MNRIAAQLGLPDADSRSAAMDAQTLEAIRGSLSSTPPDFWSVVGHTELDMYVAIAAGQLAQHVDSLVNDFGRHHERVGSRRMWGSVLDDATFVLSRYQRVASPGEQRAAGRLLDTLGILAGRPVAAARPAATAAERRPARKAPAVRKGKRQKPAMPAASTGTKRRPGRKRPRR
jgi:hypothetical protein